MNEYNINPIIWFAKRQIEFPPKHFIKVQTHVTEESKQWVLDNLTGRFCILVDTSDFFTLDSLGRIYFENPKDAMLFELKWS